MKKNIKILILTALISLSSCSSRKVAEYRICSTREINFSKMEHYVRGTNRVSGKDDRHVILTFPVSRISMDEAVDKAISNEVGCVALLDVEIYFFRIGPYIRFTMEKTGLGNKDFSRCVLGFRFNPGGQVNGITDQGQMAPREGADIANTCCSFCNPDADFEFRQIHFQGQDTVHEDLVKAAYCGG